MKKVVILASEHCLFSSIGGPMDIFLQAGMLFSMVDTSSSWPSRSRKPDELIVCACV